MLHAATGRKDSGEPRGSPLRRVAPLVRHGGKQGGGVKRLWLYLEGRKLVAFGLVLVAAGNAAAQTGGWLLVRDAIDNSIRAGSEEAPP